MQTQTVKMSMYEASKLWRKYQEHRAYATPIDLEIERIYKEIARGKTVIRALASIVAAGLGDDTLPKLAIARADATKVYLDLHTRGSGRMADVPWVKGNTAASRVFNFADDSFSRRFNHRRGQAIVPHIPPDIRPRRGLANYHILFEAIWEKAPPVDPILLRRIGQGDNWLVVAAWNLTEVERACMADRIKP